MANIQMSPVGRFEKLMLATDGTEFSESAETLALDLATRAGAKLHIMRAVIIEGSWGIFSATGGTNSTDEAKEQVEHLQKEALSLGIDCTMAIPSAEDPSKAIIKEARRIQADMIIIGRHERDAINRMLMGGNVIGYAPCPVMVAPRGSHFWEDVVIATDGSRTSDSATVMAGAISKCCKTGVKVLSVKVPSHSERRQAEAEKIVERALRYYEQEGVEAEGIVRAGPFEDIVIEEEHDGNSLIILGSHGRTGAGRTLFGSRTERIVNLSTGPVLVVNAGS